MKTLMVIMGLLISISVSAQTTVLPQKKTQSTKLAPKTASKAAPTKAVKKESKTIPTKTSAKPGSPIKLGEVKQQPKLEPATEQKTVQINNLNKTPKAIFLIKRAKVDADIGEPVLYPFERQLENIYYDIPAGFLKNE